VSAGFDLDRMRAAYAVPHDGPWLRVNFVSSLDGAATLGGRSGALGDADDQRLMSVIRSTADLVLVGSGTVAAEGYGGAAVDPADAAWRVSRGMPPQPRFGVVSSRLGLGPRHPFFADAVARPVVVTSESAPEAERTALAEVADVVVCGADRVDLVRMVVDLAASGLRSVLCEGGPGLFGALIAADLVDEFCLTLSPKLVGGAATRVAASAAEHPRGMRLAHAIEGERMLFLRYVRGEHRAGD
jgi:riboflavin-specific deaminase-like protein